MASKRFEKGSVEFQWFGDFWSMVQKNWIPEDTDEYWGGVIKDVREFSDKYKQNPEIILFTAYMVKAIQDYLTAKDKVKKQDFKYTDSILSWFVKHTNLGESA